MPAVKADETSAAAPSLDTLPEPASAPRARGWRETWAIYGQPRLLLVLVLGFASGLPLLLTLSTLAIWLAEQRVTLTAIGLFAMVGTPYTLKFLWAPVVDRAPLPGLTRRLGRRRSWLVAIQSALILAVVGLGATQPAEAPWWTAAAALLVAFLSASQDIVIDAYRIELVAEHEQGAAAAMTQLGYRIGMLASGAGALLLAEHVSWFGVYATMAGMLLVGVIATLMGPEPTVAAADTGSASLLSRLRAAVVEPFVEFVGRQGLGAAAVILAFILLYKLGDAFAGVMANPFYVQVGFTKSEIAAVTKIFGLAATLAGVVVGGAIVSRYGILRALLACGLLQMLSNLMFAVQAVVGHDVRVLVATIGVENLSGGMGSAAFVAYLSVLCNVAYTATQYALFSSFMAVGRTLLASGSGWVAEHVDWASFFLLSTVLAAPGLLLLVWMIRRFPAAGRPAGAREAGGLG
jgi:PAT family beta-lactamase induction signal transducer AmpG